MRAKKQIVEIQKYNNALGDYELYYQCHASVQSMYGEEYYAARNNNPKVHINIKIRFCNLAKEIMFHENEYRVFYQNTYFDIEEVQNPMSRNKELIIKAVK